MPVEYRIWIDAGPTEYITLTAPDLATRPELDFGAAPSITMGDNPDGLSMLVKIVELPDAVRPTIPNYLSWALLRVPASMFVPYDITSGVPPITESGIIEARPTSSTAATTPVVATLGALGIDAVAVGNGEIMFDNSDTPSFTIPSATVQNWPALWSGPDLIP